MLLSVLTAAVNSQTVEQHHAKLCLSRQVLETRVLTYVIYEPATLRGRCMCHLAEEQWPTAATRSACHRRPIGRCLQAIFGFNNARA